MQEAAGTSCELWREIMGKLVLACCAFSFICGAFTVVVVEKGRGCTVEFSRGNVTTVLVGK